jgi:hypothetical protein
MQSSQTLGVHGPRASAKNARKVGRMREKLGENQPGNEGHQFSRVWSTEDFTDLQDIVKQHAEQDLAWETDISQTSSMIPGLAKKFMEAPIKALAVLQCLSVKLIKYKEWQ